MEKHKCKLCLRKFANGRALGGHVRSHKINLYPPPPPPKAKLLLQEMTSEEEEEEEEDDIDSSSQSSSSFTSSDDDEFEDDQDKGWRLNSQKSLSSHSYQEKKSESEESSRNHFFRSQSKRVRSSRISGAHQVFFNKDAIFRQPICENERKSQALESPLMEEEAAEPLSSSISETTPEEDIAHCLMMLSRDQWTKTEPIKKSELESSESKDKDQCQDYDPKVMKSSRSKGKYRCETCDKVFKSYQALGGHRASHKRNKLTNFASTTQKEILSGGNAVVEVRLHKCPVCLKVFSSGQALGGHKRSHGSSTLRLSSGNCKGLIDLNLPAPIDDEDEISQVVEQISAVSEDEFVKLH